MRHTRTSTLLAAAALVALLAPSAADARSRRPVPKVTSVRCWPVSSCGRNHHVVAPGGRLRFTGRNLAKKGMHVVFRGSVRAADGGSRGPTALTAKLRLRRPAGFVATVPLSAHSGRIRIVASDGRRSNVVGPISIRKPSPRLQGPSPSGTGTAFDGTGMWIWYVKDSSGGSLPSIVAQAQQYGVRTVFVKSSDGTSWWSQFSPALVTQLKAAGLHVCAWQFVYGTNASTEADLGARAAQTGADCLAIDAESQYEGRYAQAQTYIQRLRSEVGPIYPVALASFPYVDYHPALPYSVFMGPNGAQYNVPQVYWKAIGTTPDAALAHTYQWNSVYQRKIFPLGQLYSSPSANDVRRFRALAAGYGASGVSWWSWQSASQAGWAAIVPPDPASALVAPPTYPVLKKGAKGDVVVWAQEHLIMAGQPLSASGTYDATTVQAVSAFQASRGIPPSGVIDQPTWTALLELAPAPVSWTSSARTARAASSRNGPRSAFLPAKRYEIPPRPPGS